MKFRLEMIPIRLRPTVYNLILTLFIFQCTTRDSDILGVYEADPHLPGILIADSTWNTFNFPDSTGSLQCSITVEHNFYNLYTGPHQDSLQRSNFDTNPKLTLYNLKVNQIVFYKLIALSGTRDSLIDTGSIKTPSGTPPKMPVNITATGDFSGVLIKWEFSGQVSNFVIYRSDTLDSNFEKIGETYGTSFFDSLNSFDIYRYTVAARNQFGESRCTLFTSSSKIINLAAPDSLSASKGSHYRQINLSWKPNSNADRYNIFRADSSTGIYYRIATDITDSFYSDTVKTYSFYFYKVSSLDQYGHSGPSSAYDSGFSKIFLNSPIISDISKGVYDNRIYIYWNKVEHGIGYQIYRSDDNEQYTAIAITSDTFFVDFVKTSDKYYYEISTISPDSLEGSRSIFKIGYVSEISIPQNVRVLDNSVNCILLSWDSVSIAAQYNVYRTNDTISEYTFLGTSETNHYCDQVLPGSVWYYEVSAVNKYGVEGNRSIFVQGEGPELINPSKLTASQGTNQAFVTLTWSRVSGAIGYHIYRSTPSSSYTLITSKITDTLYNDSSASDMNYYRICAVDSSGSEGIYSNVITGYPATMDTISNLRGSIDIPDSIQISWTKAPIAENYIIYRSPIAVTGPYTPVDTVAVPIYHDVTLNSAYYKIAVQYHSRVGKLSGHVFAKKMQPPSNLRSMAERGYLRLMWDTSNGATSYNVYRSSDNIYYSSPKNVSSFFYDDSSITDGIYYYKVTSISSNGETSLSASISVRYKSGVSNFSVTSRSDILVLSWSELTNASGYLVYFSSAPDSGYILHSTVTDTFAFITPSSSGTYYCKIQAYVSGVYTSSSEIKNGSIVAKPLEPNLVSIQSELGHIDLQWENNESGEQATSFIIYRSTSSSSGYTIIDTVSNTTYSDVPPLLSYTYYYKVAGINQSGIGKQSSYLYAAALPLPSPQLLSVSNNVYGTHVALTWSNIDEAEKYIVARSTDNSTLSIIDTCTDTTYNDSTAIAGTTYYYYVSSTRTSETSYWSSYQTGSRLPPPNVSAGNSYDYIMVNWSTVYNALSYYIYRSLYGTGPFAKIDSTTSNVYRDSVTSGGYFYYKISSMNMTESETNLTPVSARLQLPSSPTTISASQGEHQDTIMVSWQAAYGAKQYGLYRSNNSSFVDPILITTTPDTFFLNHVPSDSFYYYKVKSINNAGESILNTYAAMGFSIPQTVPDPVIDFNIRSTVSYIELYWSTPDFYEVPFKGFLVYRSESEAGPFTLADTVSGSSYFDEVEKTYPSRYWYFVKSYNLRGASTPSDILSGSRQ